MPTVPELKEELTRLGLSWKQGENKAVLEERIAAHLASVSDKTVTDISDAPDPTEAPDYIGRAELKSQVSEDSSTLGSDTALYNTSSTFIDPNWGNK